MRLAPLLLLTALVGIPFASPVLAQSCPPRATLCNPFPSSSGWTGNGDFSHQPTGGNPDGYIQIADEEAPLFQSLARDFSFDASRTVFFDAFGVATDGARYEPVLIVDDMSLPYLFLDTNRLSDWPELTANWNRYEVPLTNLGTDGAIWYVEEGPLARAATEEDIRERLSDGERPIKIQYRKVGGGPGRIETSGLDNVGIRRTSDISLVASAEQVIPGETFEIAVVAGRDEPVNGLYGVSFIAAYDVLQTLFVEFVPDPAFTECDGDPNTEDAVTLVTPVSEVLAIAVSRRADRCEVGTTGEVTIGRLVFEVPLAVPGGPARFVIADVEALNTSGERQTALPSGTSVEVVDGVVVWPGDTDQSGSVDGADLLPIANRFAVVGPGREEQGYTWAPIITARWDDADDTHADANGDGIIRESDVLAVGLNYGRTTSAARGAAAKGAPLARIALQPLAAGETFDVTLDFDASGQEVMGAAALLALPDGIAVDAAGAGAWLDDGDLLTFDTTVGGRLDLAVSRKRGAAPLAGAGEALSLRLRATQALPQTEIVLERVTLGTASGGTVAASPEAVTLGSSVAVAGETAPEAAFGLGAVAPNPVRGTSRIVWSLEASDEAHLAVYDALGREVTVLASGDHAAGRHSATLDARGLAPGVYVVRLASGERAETQRLTVVR